MTGVRRLLAGMSARELEQCAGELLAALSASAAPAPAPAPAERNEAEGARPGEGAGEEALRRTAEDDGFFVRDGGTRAEENVPEALSFPARPGGAGFPLPSLRERTEETEWEEGGVFAPDREAERLSEAFRRDCRRYDGPFRRY